VSTWEPVDEDPGTVFREVMGRIGKGRGERRLSFPREIVFLNGAPGAGKGQQTPFILGVRGLSSKPIVMSDLMDDPKLQGYKDRGDMIPTEVVVEALFRELLNPLNSNGVVVDGFPRTETQVEILKLLYDKMVELRKTNASANGYYPKPRFFIAILYVSERVSIQRQIKRGKEALRHNARVRDSGYGDIVPVRPTDLDEALVAKRYHTFRQHKNTLFKLRDHFPFTVIDAEDSIENVQQKIASQFMYQSSQELRQETFDMIQKIPLAYRIREDARPELVERLDGYQREHTALLQAAVDEVRLNFLPVIIRAAFAGEAVVRADHAGLWEDPLFVQICLDVLAERGFQCRYDTKTLVMPLRVHPRTHEVESEVKVTHVFFIRFPEASLTRTHLKKSPFD